MYAEVIIEYNAKQIDKIFTYKVPLKLQKKLTKGMKVLVPFNNSVINGFVLNILTEFEAEYELKEIVDIVDKELVLTDELLSLAHYLSEETLCSKISAIQTMLPTGLKVKTNKTNYNKMITLISLNENCNIEEYLTKKRTPGQIEIINKLKSENEIEKSLISGSSLNTLIKNGVVKETQKQVYRINKDCDKSENKVLTVEQNDVFQKIKDSLNKFKVFLLQGITGSGKTEIYIKLIKEVLKKDKTAILLVPEISLTTQIANRLYNIFGSDVAILHSSLSNGERYDEYLKILKGEVSVVVGTRSAIFAPLENLGIIIIDEEDSSSYKQDVNPKYHAKDMAIFRAKYNNIPLLLGSATPSLEAKARADKNVYTLLKLDKRIGNAKLPKVYLVDMAKEMANRKMTFSTLLEDKIRDRLNKKEQIILLLNRRGFSTFVTCSNCGYTYKCPNCDITLTYHKSSNNLICHYCGYKISKSKLCPKCHEDALNYFGLGTEKLELEIKKLFPNARVVRMDQDNTRRKGMHEKIIQDFKDEKYDILLGTQMVSKGLDFPKVSLVGVINADTSLNIPDFRSNENTFSLLYQVAGRAGRSNIPGEVIIQTFNPDNYVMKQIASQNYEQFYLYEMNFRQKLKYPPYYFLVSLKVIGKDYEETLKESYKVKRYLDKNLSFNTIILGPTMANVLKYKNEYRFQFIIKYKFDDKLKDTLKELDKIYAINKKVRIDVDFNPLRI